LHLASATTQFPLIALWMHTAKNTRIIKKEKSRYNDLEKFVK
jgi:hypothetical protein